MEHEISKLKPVDLPRLRRMPYVKAFTNLSDPTIWRKVKDGTFPRPIRIGAKSVAWLEEDLIEWVQQLVDARRNDSLSHSKQHGSAVGVGPSRKQEG